MGTDTLRDILKQYVREGELYTPLEQGWVQCFACGHRCRISSGHEGICKVRFNEGGKLFVPHGYVAGLQVDPIEKKPFFHALPGSKALSFGMLGCDYHCDYCQNWYSSQALRDPFAGTPPEPIAAEQVLAIALEHHTPVITSTYNEPLITTEWAVAIFQLAKKHGIRCSYVSNGNGTPEVLEYLRPFIDLCKIDLKSFSKKSYQALGGRLEAVLETIRAVKELNIWMEIVTLVVPGFNDEDGELRDIAEFLASISSDIPWHVTAFHQDYKMTGPSSTPPSTLLRAAEIGRNAGLHYVYAGNLPSRTGPLENTHCPSCSSTIIERTGFTVLKNSLQDGACPHCGTPIAGVWT